MGEPLVATCHSSQAGPFSSSCYYSKINDPPSPGSQRYKIKHAFLQEKFDYIEAETDILRRRVQEVRREVEQALELRRTLCNMLDERGDHWYKGVIEMDEKEPSYLNPDAHELSLLRCDTVEMAPKKRSRPSGRSRAKAAKLKQQQMLTEEQKLEEERARAKIVSIIDSVFSETARKTARIEQEMKNKVASVTKDVVGKNSINQHGSRNTGGGQHTKNSSIGSKSATGNARSKSNQATNKTSRHIPYKVYTTKSKGNAAKLSDQKINGMVEGIKFTYIPHKTGRQSTQSSATKNITNVPSTVPSSSLPVVIVTEPKTSADTALVENVEQSLEVFVAPFEPTEGDIPTAQESKSSDSASTSN